MFTEKQMCDGIIKQFTSKGELFLLVKYIHFFHPELNVLMSAEYDPEGETLMFDFGLRPGSTIKESDQAKTQQLIDWCMSNHINCYSLKQANNHLAYLGINERFE